jgi:hypothetical protein
VPKALLFGGGAGVQVLKMDPIEHGPRSYTPFQYLYVAHDDFRMMNYEPAEGQKVGRMVIRSAGAENLPVGAVFKWEYYTGEDAGCPWSSTTRRAEVLGMPEIGLKTALPDISPLAHFGNDDDKFEVPEPLREEKHWLRGTVDYERWLAHRMIEDLEISLARRSRGRGAQDQQLGSAQHRPHPGVLHPGHAADPRRVDGHVHDDRSLDDRRA